MKEYYYFALFAVLGLISFSEGKPCPERNRPHKTRCNAYYKCTVIDNKKHVWVPAECEEGLIYEHSLGVCVLPGDDWECGQKNVAQEKTTKPAMRKVTNHNKDADVYIVSNAEGDDDEENMINSNYDDSKVEIVFGTDLSDEIDEDNESEEIGEHQMYDGSGNGAELVELDGFIQAPENRETEDVMIVKGVDRKKPLVEKKEQLQEVLHTIKTKADIGLPTSNIDPNLTAQLQRLSQLVDGLKQSYQNGDQKKPQQNLGPDKLNAFLAHFNIKNTEETNLETNKTSEYKKDVNNSLSPETKVVLNNNLPKRYLNQQTSDSSSNGGGYSNSQIVINRPGGAVLFSLPSDSHFTDHSEYSSADNTPKISEETLKTVLELSKQMIASQNIPKIIPNPAYYGSSIMQPVYLTSNMNSPFSTDYYGGSSGSQSVFSSDFPTHNVRYKRPGKMPQQGQNPTTIIHNNVIPVHVSGGDKDVLDSYGQNVALYPPLNGQEEKPSTGYNGGSSHSSYDSNKYLNPTTQRPSSSMMATDSPLYGNNPKPYDFEPTSSTFNKYFTPTEHLNENNINEIFQTTDNYGSVPQPVKLRRPSSNQQSGQSQDKYGSMFSQIGNNQIYGNQNSQQLQYSDNNGDDSDTISYDYGQSMPGSSSQSVFSYNKNPYANKLNSGPLSSSSYGSFGNKNKYSSLSSAISSSSSASSFNEGAQLVNVGGNFINYEVFRNTILPLMGGNSKAASVFNNVEVITCAAGVRQPNTTDCTRYYVCSKKDGKVLSYSCPPYTAFNAESRICDARTYALCNSDTNMLPTYSINENKRIQMETLKALQEAKRKQISMQQHNSQTLQAQQFANILQQYNSPQSSSNSLNSLQSLVSSSSDSSEDNMLQSYMQQAAAMASMAQTTSRPSITSPSASKKRKYYCKEGDKIADQTSINSYFVCFKNSEGQMKGHKMTCTKGLIFCPKTTMCTLPSKCS